MCIHVCIYIYVYIYQYAYIYTYHAKSKTFTIWYLTKAAFSSRPSPQIACISVDLDHPQRLCPTIFVLQCNKTSISFACFQVCSNFLSHSLPCSLPEENRKFSSFIMKGNLINDRATWGQDNDGETHRNC